VHESEEVGRDIRKSWDLSEAFRIADRATGTRVLQSLCEKMKDKPVQVDLHGLWVDLGVHFDGQKLKFDEDARFAAIRRAITTDSRSAEKRSSSGRPAAILAGCTVRRPRSVA